MALIRWKASKVWTHLSNILREVFLFEWNYNLIPKSIKTANNGEESRGTSGGHSRRHICVSLSRIHCLIACKKWAQLSSIAPKTERDWEHWHNSWSTSCQLRCSTCSEVQRKRTHRVQCTRQCRVGNHCPPYPKALIGFLSGPTAIGLRLCFEGVFVVAVVPVVPAVPLMAGMALHSQLASCRSTTNSLLRWPPFATTV